jgi:hypothetical protein
MAARSQVLDATNSTLREAPTGRMRLLAFVRQPRDLQTNHA